MGDRDDLETVKPAPFTPSRWAVNWGRSNLATGGKTFPDEAQALEFARGALGLNITHVWVEATAIEVDGPCSWAIRHLHYDGADSGWRCWHGPSYRDAEFIGAVSFGLTLVVVRAGTAYPSDAEDA